MKNVENINRIKIAYKKVSRSQVKAQVRYSLNIRVGMYGNKTRLLIIVNVSVRCIDVEQVSTRWLP